MKIEQESEVSASRDRIWSVLEDVPRAAALIPGVKDVEATGNDTYSGIMQVGVGPMKLNLQGELRATQNRDDYTWRIEGQANDRRLGGGLRVIVDAAIAEAGAERSSLKVATDIQFMGRVGTLGQPLIRSKANSQMKDFIKNLEKELKK